MLRKWRDFEKLMLIGTTIRPNRSSRLENEWRLGICRMSKKRVTTVDMRGPVRPLVRGAGDVIDMDGTCRVISSIAPMLYMVRPVSEGIESW